MSDWFEFNTPRAPHWLSIILSNHKNFAVQKELKEAFRLYDKEGNGYIPTSCLKEILRELDDQLSDSDLDGLISEIDTDGSGTVDFDGKLLMRLKTELRVNGWKSELKVKSEMIDKLVLLSLVETETETCF